MPPDTGVLVPTVEHCGSMRPTLLLLALPLFAFVACSSSAPVEPSNDAGTKSEPLTYHEHAEAILQDKCQSCHRPGGLAPFSLLTYEDVRKRAASVVDQMKTRAMPPWGAFAAPECTPRHKLANDLGVAEADINVIAKWYEQGAVEGDPKKAPPARTFTDQKLADPTFSAAIAAHVVPPADRDEHICFPLDPKITEEVFLDGIAVTPGNTKVVHHVLVYGDPKNEGAAKAGAAGSYPCFGGPGVSNASVVGAWVPGIEPTIYPVGVGMKMPKGIKLVMQMHYHPGASTETDSTKVELRVAKSTPSWEARVQLVGNFRNAPLLLAGPNDTGSPTFLIPANAKAHTEEMLVPMPEILADVRVAAVSPHMHWAGTAFKAEIERAIPTATAPAKECLINAPKYDFNWQRGYAYNASIEDLPRLNTGDKLRIKCTYDNSMDNRHVASALIDAKQPAPSDITLGEDTLDEMCLGGFTLYTKM